MFTPALRRNVRYRAFEQFQKRLLNALAGYVACDGRILALAGDLIDLVNVDYALFGALNVKIGSLQKPQKNILNVFADIAGFGERRCIGYCKGHIEHLGQRLRKQSFAAAGRADEKNIALLKLNVVIAGIEDAFIMVIHRDRQNYLCSVLPDDVFIQPCLYLGRLRKILKAQAVSLAVMHGSLLILGDDAHAEIDALITDVCAVSGNESAGLSLCFSAERAADALSVVCSCHSFTSRNDVIWGNRKFPHTEIAYRLVITLSIRPYSRASCADMK